MRVQLNPTTGDVYFATLLSGYIGYFALRLRGQTADQPVWLPLVACLALPLGMWILRNDAVMRWSDVIFALLLALALQTPLVIHWWFADPPVRIPILKATLAML